MRVVGQYYATKRLNYARFGCMTLAFVYGTRPEAIKTGPVVSELRLRGIDPLLLCTGQHDSLLKGTPAESDLAQSVSLALPSDGTVWEWVRTGSQRLRHEFVARGVTGVVVQGDTMSALAGARAACYQGLPLYHVEAGIRSGSLTEPWPEERIRMEIAQMAVWHYAPTETARCNLVGEGISRARILVTGNPVVSAIARYAPDVQPAVTPGNHIVVTMHRREAREIGAIRDALAAVWKWAELHPECDVIWPAHPGTGLPKIRTSNFWVCEPLPYREMLQLVNRSVGIATDSGGLQEEAATLGVPCAVLRNITDRPESVDLGLACLFPPGGTGIIKALDALWMRQIDRIPSDCYGTVHSARNIAAHIASSR